MNSSDTSAKYSWPIRLQNEEIHDSGVPDEVDIATEKNALGRQRDLYDCELSKPLVFVGS